MAKTVEVHEKPIRDLPKGERLTDIVDPLARTGRCAHSILPEFEVYQQGGLDCYCGSYAIVNLICFIKKYLCKSRNMLTADERTKVLESFDDLHERLGLLGGEGSEGYRLLPSAYAAFFEAGFKDARFSLREGRPIRSEQSRNELKMSARVGIHLPQDLQAKAGRTLALTSVYECNPTPVDTWNIRDELGHWIAIVGKGNIPKTHGAALDGYDGIVLDSSRGYGLWKLDEESGLRLNRPADPSGARDVRVWVYSLITIQID
jgi:hypothetical protein